MLLNSSSFKSGPQVTWISAPVADTLGGATNWDDLNADIYKLKDGKIYNIEKDTYEVHPAAREFLKHFPPDSEIVINTDAAKHLWQLNKKLVFSGVIDVFDYGFVEIEYPFDLMRSFVRREKGYVTYDINFIYMKAFARALGLNVYVELQDNYVCSIFPNVRPVETEKGLYYMTPEEIERNRPSLCMKGYSDVFFSGGIKEEADYYHMRIWK